MYGHYPTGYRRLQKHQLVRWTRAAGVFYNRFMKPIVLCGPTASGKTELALEIARQTGGVIISADSRQVYKRLTVGTAKPQGVYQNGLYTVENIPYLLVDFLDVTDTFIAGNFCARVREITTAFHGKPLIFAGGTGLYLHAYFVGMDHLPPSTPQTRARLQEILSAQGKQGLHEQLSRLDPLSAQQIPPANVQRTMRALELCWLTNKPASALKSGQFFKLPDEKTSHWVYLNWDKDFLEKRIQTRTEKMFDAMCAETRQLLADGFAKNVPALKSVGYPQILDFLDGKLSREQAVSEIVLKTRQYAKRQRTWFNRYTNAQKINLTSNADFDVKKIAQTVVACANP